MQDQEHGRKLAHVIAKSWQDPAFHARLKADPEKTLKEEGVTVPPGVKVSVHQDDEHVHHLVIPRKPREWKDSDVEHQRVSPMLCPLCTF